MRPTLDITFDHDYTPTNAAGSAEPFARPDHKSKKHPRPRRNEKVGGGHFVFRRGGRTGRIKTGSILAGKLPFEHPDMESARTEADRLQKLHGGRYDVFSTSAIVDGEAA
jgi:hypothetical protein